jgi:hypothetical protein
LKEQIPFRESPIARSDTPGVVMDEDMVNRLEEIDAAIFSGDILYTDFDAFNEYIQRWKRACDAHEPLLEEETSNA